jgi:hypothetical protein
MTFTTNIIQRGRGGGKTYAIMTEINDLITQQRRQEILVVFPDHHYVYWWVGEWRRRFGSTPPPEYITVANRLKLRGRRVAKVYVEDVDQIPDGIYNDVFREIAPAMWSAFDDAEIICTSSWIGMNQITHPRITTAAEIQAQFIRNVKLRSSST